MQLRPKLIQLFPKPLHTFNHAKVHLKVEQTESREQVVVVHQVLTQGNVTLLALEDASGASILDLFSPTCGKKQG